MWVLPAIFQTSASLLDLDLTTASPSTRPTNDVQPAAAARLDPGLSSSTRSVRRTTKNTLLTAFLDKPEFRETVTRMIGKDFYDKIRLPR